MHTKQQLNEMKNEHDQWRDRIRFYKYEICKTLSGQLVMLLYTQTKYKEPEILIFRNM